MLRRPPRSTLSSSSAASDVYKRQVGCRRARALVQRPGAGQGSSRGRMPSADRTTPAIAVLRQRRTAVDGHLPSPVCTVPTMSNGPAVAQIGRDVRAAPPCCRLDRRRGADPRSGGLRWRRCQRARGSRHQRGRPCVHPAGGGQHIGRRAGRRQQPYRVGGMPQHVVPAWDLATLYVTNNSGNSLTPIDPRTGKPGAEIPVDDPYNMYFTPDGKYAIVVAEALQRLDFRDPHTFALVKSVKVDCKGIDHIDFAADDSYLIGTCEFAGKLVKLDLRTQEVIGYITTGGMPQDIKLDPAGTTFYVADMQANGLHIVDGAAFTKTGFLPTGKGAHGLYPSRDASVMYVSNRGEGTISVVDFATGKITATWDLGNRTDSPDMGGVSVDGNVLWLSGRYSSVVYAVDTRTGKLIHRIPVGKGPHGLCVWPQPGRYSLGHTGILR